MARCRYQSGCLFVRGKRRKVWVARWREEVILADGSISRVLRSEVLGPKSLIPSQAEARKLLDARIRPINHGLHRPQAALPFSTFVVQHFEPGVLPTLKFSTQRSYTWLMRKYLLPHFGKMTLSEISKFEVQRFVLDKLNNGFSWKTTCHIRNLLSKAMGMGIEWGFITQNPVSGVKLPHRTFAKPPGFLTQDEAHRLVLAMEDPVRTIALLAIVGGLRIGEILALRWGRINFERSTLRVEETCYLGIFDTPKTLASRREVPMAQPVVDALRRHMNRSRDSSEEALVFATKNGTPLSANNLRRRHLVPACDKAGIRRIGWHALRHTHSTLLHAQGTPLKYAQAQLGHSYMSTTLDIYTHIVTDGQRDAVNKLGDVLFPSVPTLHKNAAKPEEAKPLIQ